jgi:ketosteroid isomerase-like protein
MKRLAVTFLAAAALLIVPPAALSEKPAADPKAEQAVRAAMDQFAKAVVGKDKATLERLMGDAVMYGHSNGKLDSKTSFINDVMTENPKYESFTYGESTFKTYGSTVIVRGPITVKDILSGQHRTIELNALQVWMKGSTGWTLIGRQATRMNP